MLYITYSILLVYILPIVLIVLSIFTTKFFTIESSTVYMANFISDAYIAFFRDSFGTIVVPLVTAYSIQHREPSKPVPKTTLHLFFTLLSFFLITIMLYALIKYRADILSKYNTTDSEGKIIQDIPNVYMNTLLAYTKESLAYIALLLGITLKK